MPMDYVSLCLIIKDEEEYIKEWLDYHILIGVDRFYIYDNESAIDLQVYLADYIHKGWVLIQSIKGRAMQLAAYDHCLQSYGKNTKWLGFIDTDEFVVLKKDNSLKDFLSRFEPYGGVGISSLFFGSSGYRKKPKKGQIASYAIRTAETFPENWLVKSFVQPEYVLYPDSPHEFIYKYPYYCVNEKGFRVDYQKAPVHIQAIQLNHYYCRSEEDMLKKFNRGEGGAGRPHVMEAFQYANKNAKIVDVEALKSIARISKMESAEIKKIGILNFLNLQFQKAHSPTMPVQKSDQNPNSIRPELQICINQKSELKALRDNPEAACILLTQLIHEYPGILLHQTAFAAHQLILGNYDSAWQALAKAWKQAPGAYEVLRVLADYFFVTEQYAKAEKTFRAMLDQSVNSSTLMRLGLALIKLEKWDDALQCVFPIFQDEESVLLLEKEMILDLICVLGIHYVDRNDKITAQKIIQIGQAFFVGEERFNDLISRSKKADSKKDSSFSNPNRYIK